MDSKATSVGPIIDDSSDGDSTVGSEQRDVAGDGYLSYSLVHPESQTSSSSKSKISPAKHDHLNTSGISAASAVSSKNDLKSAISTLEQVLSI